MRPILVLFDIDGTILKVNDGISRNVFQKVICEFFNLKIIEQDFDLDFSGLTDLEILYKFAQIYGLDFEKVLSNQKILFKQIFEEFHSNCRKEHIYVYDNAAEFIVELNEKDWITLGLLTGNFKDCAYYKLELVGLDKYFPFGAFGDENLKRSQLHSLAIERANNFVGSNLFSCENTIVIGDSVPDILSARENNIRVISVATGRTTFETLATKRPDLLIHNFSEKEKIYNFLGI